MKKTNIFLIIVLVTLIAASLACSKAGQIVSVAEATEIAGLVEKRTGLDTSYKNAEGSVFIADDIVSFYAGEGVELVPLFKDAGDRKPYTEIKAGINGKVDSSVVVDGVVWYKILNSVANGYVTLEGLKDPSDGGNVVAFEIGDTPYLDGISYLVQLFNEPGSLMATIQQEKGIQVEILEIADLDGVAWYKVSSPAGDGWVLTESLSVEPLD